MLVEWKSLSDYPFQSFVYYVVLFYLYVPKSLNTFHYIGYILIFRAKFSAVKI